VSALIAAAPIACSLTLRRNCSVSPTRRRPFLAACLALALPFTAIAQQPSPGTVARLEAAVMGGNRSERDRSRDAYRHPIQTLLFFGIRPDMSVVEVWPEGGWYTRILGPFLKDNGKLYLATSEADARNRENANGLRKQVMGNPEVYGVPVFTVLDREMYDIAPANSADMVVTFRNVHNWMGAGFAPDAFRAMYRALKPGGVLGIEEHRAKPGPQDPKARSGYVTEAFVTGLAEAAGFRLVASSGINANPKDTKDYPKGVWALPPSYALGAAERPRYAAIGESDRMTLKFVKPAARTPAVDE
jgi:predicted methyltransferase